MNFWSKRRGELTKKVGKFVSQHKIAVALGVTPALVGLWERGELAPNLRMARDLARVYEVPLERIEKEIVDMNREISDRETASAGR